MEGDSVPQHLQRALVSDRSTPDLSEGRAPLRARTPANESLISRCSAVQMAENFARHESRHPPRRPGPLHSRAGWRQDTPTLASLSSCDFYGVQLQPPHEPKISPSRADLELQVLPRAQVSSFSLTLCVEEPILTCQMPLCPLECDGARALGAHAPCPPPPLHGACVGQGGKDSCHPRAVIAVPRTLLAVPAAVTMGTMCTLTAERAGVSSREHAGVCSPK